ncbi:chaperonin 10-like protein [Blyttiomyces helicus]|uniref:Chaperonin 10-like protein n=1 Tax=Blyttiomyces helicus TaxID=388810 RepID=A0A4P9W5D7_9FUNG|nr:chaperonin 10-like protein [Blyttiomyces helicus]|eukprot:RKO87621.1 chaperonin 10-like protein [Blyttiomyces helicus]
MSVHETMRAWVVTARGAPKSAAKTAERQRGANYLAAGEVLIKVQRTALNPVGYKIAAVLPGLARTLPAIAEFDLAGVVVDPNGSEFAVGDEVCGMVDIVAHVRGGRGAIAEYAVKETNLIRKPKPLTLEQAGGLTLIGLTAYESLITSGKPAASERVFINGGSSSVGIVGIQIAKAVGAYVVASCSGKNIDFVEGLGADQVRP